MGASRRRSRSSARCASRACTRSGAARRCARSSSVRAASRTSRSGRARCTRVRTSGSANSASSSCSPSGCSATSRACRCKQAQSGETGAAQAMSVGQQICFVTCRRRRRSAGSSSASTTSSTSSAGAPAGPHRPRRRRALHPAPRAGSHGARRGPELDVAPLSRGDLSRDDYVRLSGGVTQRADTERTFIVRADGSVAAAESGALVQPRRAEKRAARATRSSCRSTPSA